MDDEELDEESVVVLAVADELDVLPVAEELLVIEPVESVEPDAVEEPVALEEPLVELAVTEPTAVPDALGMPKFGEKLMLLVFVSSIISMVY